MCAKYATKEKKEEVELFTAEEENINQSKNYTHESCNTFLNLDEL